MNLSDKRPREIDVMTRAIAEGKDIFTAFVEAGYSVVEAALYAEEQPTGPTCPDCADQGQLGPNQFCHCEVGQRMLAERINLIRKKSRIPQRYERLTFDSWRELPDALKTGKKLAFFAAYIFAHRPGHWLRLGECFESMGDVMPPELYSDPERNAIVFCGTYGTGKTGFAAAIANELMMAEPLVWTRVSALIDRIQRTYKDDYQPATGDSRDEIIDLCSTVPLLILDEFGGEHSSKDRRDIMESIVRARCAAELPFVVTTNHVIDAQTGRPESFQQEWGPRITEVILEAAHWIPVGGRSLRQQAQVLKPL